MSSAGIRIEGGITVGGGIYIGGTGGGGGGGGFSALTLNIAGISGTSVPDTSGNGNNGTLVGTYSTNTDSHGAYVYLNGGYIDIAGYNIPSAPFTIRLITAIDASQTYWASLWGNEAFTSNKGYLAYLGTNTSMSVGPIGGLGAFSVGLITAATQWDFVVDSTTVSVYQNGTQVGSSSTYTAGAPSSGPGTTDLYIGSRHTNSGGTGPYDPCKMKLYSAKVFSSALSGSTIAADYNTNKTIYSI